MSDDCYKLSGKTLTLVVACELSLSEMCDGGEFA